MNGKLAGDAWKECTRIIIGVIGVLFVVSLLYFALTLIPNTGSSHLPDVAGSGGELQPRAEPSRPAQESLLLLRHNRNCHDPNSHYGMDCCSNEKRMPRLWCKFIFFR